MTSDTLVSIFFRQAEALQDEPFLRVKVAGEYRDASWQEVCDNVRAISAGLIQFGVKPGDRIGILSENSREWIEADMAIMTAGAITVALHAPLTSHQVCEQFKDAAPEIVFVSTAEQRAKIDAIRQDLLSVKHVFAFDPAAATSDVRPISELIERGKEVLITQASILNTRSPSPEDIAAIIYTSGTTGESKGVMLTHSNFVTNCIGMEHGHPAPEVKVIFSVLPMSHVYARTVDLYWSMSTGRILALAESYDAILQNLQEVRPQYTSLVPRFHEKFASLTRPLFDAGDKDALKKLYGGRIVWVSSGGAALNPDTARYYFEASVPVFQGYGLTETSPVISFSGEGRNRIGASGTLLENVEVKIAPDGEILSRGPHIMKGYWNKPEATRQAIDPDGWFHTGDIGHLDKDGFLFITDRKKDLIVTSYGKNVAPQQLEGLLGFDPFIEQAMVCGDARPYLTALIVPCREAVSMWAQNCGMYGKTWEELLRSPELHTLIEERIACALKDLSAFEQVRKFVLLPEPFSYERGEVTLTAKLRRRNILETYRSMLDGLYES